MSVLIESTDYNDLISRGSGNNIVYANTAKAATKTDGGDYRANSKQIKKPLSKPRRFIVLRTPQPTIPIRP